MQNYNEYDIIIENIIKEWNKHHMDTKDNKWAKPEYSKKQINNAGKIIANDLSISKEAQDAIKILNNWRASHAYPLHIICNKLRRCTPNAIVVQRLKRLESIIGKIKRFPDMQLYKMQDLGGCRVIVDTTDEVYQAIETYKNSRIRHILKREYDYIQNPKESGYRSYHMVYQFQSDKINTYNKNMFIEIQFRTKLQHIWATAIEMMGIYTKSNLKSSQGDKDILRFFTLVSSVFAIKENLPICPNTSNNLNTLVKEIKMLDQKHKIISTLSGLNIVTNYVTNYNERKNNKNGYYLLTLNYDERMVNVLFFKQSSIETATHVYGQIENLQNTNVVLVSASSFKNLRFAYPNYFVDISTFINTLQEFLQ